MSDLARGQERAAAKRAAIGRDIDMRVKAAASQGVTLDAKAIAARAGLSYAQVRRSLIRLRLWRPRAGIS